MIPAAPRTRVLIVDDSAIVRRLLSAALENEPDLEVVGTAPDPIVAREKIARLKPDVLTLDVEMPRMDGITFLKELMREHPMPVILICSVGATGSRAAIEAMQHGAIDVLAKPGDAYSVEELLADLPMKIRAAARARLRLSGSLPPPTRPPAPLNYSGDPDAIIALGASTGGTEALRLVLADMPANSPAIVVVQHIPPVFSRAFADRLNACCHIRVKEAQDGEEACAGLALIAPGNFHLKIRRTGGSYRAELNAGPLVCYQRPAVDVLFESVAQFAGKHATGVILTGMGNDGARGMLKMRQAGARTIAQDEESCVVFGMPKEAIRMGGAGEVLPLGRIADALVHPRMKVA